MFENNLDFDIDENIFSDDFPPSENEIPNLICNEQKEIAASNLFKQPPIPDRVQRALTNIKVNAKHKSEKRVVQRKFPGPAGLLPEIRNDSNTNDNRFNESGGVNNDIDDMLMMCSQASLSMFQEEPWTTMRLDFKAESNYTIEWIKSNATGKSLVNQKAPFLAAVIKSIECATKLKMPTLTLKDPTDEIQADISHDLYEEHANDLTVGSVIVLRQFSVFSVKNETVHYLTITSNNLVAVYNKERQCRLDFEYRKLGHDSPSSSSSSTKCKKLNDISRLELDVLRSYTLQNIHSAEKVNPCRDKNEVADKQGESRTSSLELIQKIRDHKATPESKNSFNSLNDTSTSKFKFRAHSNLKSSEVDDLNLSLDLFSEEFSTEKITSSNLDELKPEVSPNNRNNSLKNKLDVDEESPPLKKPKTTLSQKFRDFKFKPRDDPEPAAQKADQDDVVACKSDCKGRGNFIDCSQISVVSQNKEDHDIVQDVFHNVDAESMFEDF